ncbi:unnamed protein product [Anisakis simplex]|nr:unnamed protein product [Anisakis simplex]
MCQPGALNNASFCGFNSNVNQAGTGGAAGAFNNQRLGAFGNTAGFDATANSMSALANNLTNLNQRLISNVDNLNRALQSLNSLSDNLNRNLSSNANNQSNNFANNNNATWFKNTTAVNSSTNDQPSADNQKASEGQPTVGVIADASGTRIVIGNGTSGNLWEHANWPSSVYQLDANAAH